MIIRSYDEILAKLKNYTIANQDIVTDFNQGSVLLTQYEAFARILERFYIDVRNGFASNLKMMAFSIFDFKMKNGMKATVGVKFSRAKGRDNEISIPAGVIVSSGSLRFETSETAIIKPNETDSNIISAQALEIGLKYNVEANTVTTIESLVPSEVIKVTNPKNATGGSNNESESEVLERFKVFINGLQGTNLYGIESGVMSVEGVRSISVEEHFPPVDDIYNLTVYVDDGAGSLSPSLKDKILSVINGNGTANNPGKRAAGIMVRVLAATVVPINVTVSVKVYRTEIERAKADIQQVMEDAVNNLKVHEDVILTNLILQLRRIPYIKDISILTLNGTEKNIKIPITSIAKLNTIQITVENI